MTTEEQRIAIAEVCGYTNVRYDYANGSDTFKSWLANHPRFAGNGIPDYLNDLNAMHEAEETLTVDQLESYREVLSDLLNDDCRMGLAINATAAQRAEAFLRTIGKWRDE
jgi:hypothetical protein